MARPYTPVPAGTRFGLWVVQGEGQWQTLRTRSPIRTLRCRCDCGTIRDLQVSNLKRGSTLSCGCNSKPRLRAAATTHGLSRHPLFQTLRSMKSRCHKPGSHAYENYGARGITVCEEWRGTDGARAFYDWSMSNGYRKGLTIDRIDNDKGYSPENCRWATYQQNLNNRRNTVYVFYNGEHISLSECWQRYGDGGPYRKFTSRYRNSRSVERALQVGRCKLPDLAFSSSPVAKR